MQRSARFSLLTLLLVTTIVALVLAVFQARSRLNEAQAELRRLKSQFGELSIDDGSQVHVISVPTAEAMNWRWRVYLPGGHDFGLFTYRGKLDAAGLPQKAASANRSRIGGQSDPWKPREVVIDIALGKTLEGDPCLWISKNGTAGAPVTFGSSLPTWASGVMFAERVAGKGKTVAVGPEVPIGLISLDGVDATGATCDDAVLIWIGLDEKRPTESLRDRGVLP